MQQRTALLVMDMQLPILQNLPSQELVVKKVAEAINIARSHGIPVIYVTLAFRAGMPEIHPHNKLLQAFKQRIAHLPMDTFTTIHPALAPKEGDIQVHKKRVSAFTGSDLDVMLRVMGINHLVLTGVSTSGVVLSTLREAADKDYLLTVLTDGCADADEEVHRVLTNKVFPRQATAHPVSDWNLSIES